jgi:protein O-mannosyl-transferase
VVVLSLGWRRPYLAIGWLWYLGTLIPVIGLVQVGIQARADRYTYIPMIGVSIAVVWAIAELAGRWPGFRKAVLIGTPILLGACVVLTWFQVAHWRNNLCVFSQAINATSNNYWAHSHLGFGYYNLGDKKKAAEEFQEALNINPKYDWGHNNLGVCYADEAKYDQAEKLFLRALQLNPRYTDACNNLAVIYLSRGRLADAVKYSEMAVTLGSEKTGDRLNLARGYDMLGELPKALVNYRWVLGHDPENPMAKQCAERIEAELTALQGLRQPGADNAEYHLLAAGVYVRQDKLAEAAEECRLVLVRQPGNVDVAQRVKLFERTLDLERAVSRDGSLNLETHLNLGNHYRMLGKTAKAEERFRYVLQQRPDDPHGHCGLGLIMMQERDWDGAVEHLEQAMAAYNGDADAHFALGIALARQGKRDEALKHLEAAQQINPDHPGANQALKEIRSSDYPGAK